MNWLDIIFVCLAGIGFVKGLFDGLIKQVVSLIALGLGIFFCGKAAIWFQGWLSTREWFPPEAVLIGSYVLGFLVIVGLVILAGRIVHWLIGVTPLSIVNHLLGGVIGIVLMLLFISLVLNIMDVTDMGSKLIPAETKVESRYYFRMKEVLPMIYAEGLFYVKN